MAIKNYENSFKKNSRTSDISRNPKDMVKRGILSEERKARYISWITFFRRNPVYLIQNYFGIKLFPYQILMIWILQRSTLAYIVASRAAAKSWIIAVWALTLAVLYPGMQVIIVSKTLRQGSIILGEKLRMLMNTYPNVAREIKSLTTNANVNEAIFHCGSTIKVVPAAESARGNRANYIIVEESRLVPKEILEPIIKPFLYSRKPPYMMKQQYNEDSRLQEEGTISFITSSWYKSEYWYTYVKSAIKRMLKGDVGANFLALDYLISLYHGIKTKEMLKNEMEDSDPMTVQMEYLNIPSGESGQSYFKLKLFRRNIKRSFYPQRSDNYQKKNPNAIQVIDGEIRIVSVDVATRANKTNDNTIISCARLIPLIGKGYIRQLLYMESHKGKNTVSQAKRIKQIYHDFDATFLVLDLQNAGIGIFDSLSQLTEDEERGLNYPPMTVANDPFNIDEKLMDQLRERTLGINAMPVIYPILATQNLNSQIAVAFRSSLQKKMWEFLISDGDAEEFLLKNHKDFIAMDDEDMRAFFLSPYVQTGLLINECIGLDMSLSNGLVRLVEKSGAYKDRYSSVSYLNWVATFFDKKIMKVNEEEDEWSILMDMTLVS